MSDDRERIDIEYVESVQRFIDTVNGLDLLKIDLYEKGVKVEMNPKAISMWKFTGLSNFGFFSGNFYCSPVLTVDGMGTNPNDIEYDDD
jgi:hypothetical protein